MAKQVENYNGQGRYPATGKGVVQMTVCFDVNGGDPCVEHIGVGAVRCSGFMLWQMFDTLVRKCHARTFRGQSSGRAPPKTVICTTSL